MFWPMGNLFLPNKNGFIPRRAYQSDSFIASAHDKYHPVESLITHLDAFVAALMYILMVFNIKVPFFSLASIHYSFYHSVK